MADKLKATPNMRQAVQALIDAGRITRTAYEYAVSMGYTDADVIELAERQRAVKVRLEVTGNAGLYRRRPDDDTNAPTAERARKSDGIKKISLSKELGAAKVYKVPSVLERYGDKYAVDKRSALERFLIDAQYSERVRVADLNPSGGGVPGKRLGGLGSVPDELRIAHARHQWVWYRLPADMQMTARALVSRELVKADGSPFSMEDFGGHILPSVIDRNRRWGVAAGALWALAAGLVQLYAHCPHRRRWGADDDVPDDTLGSLES